jgi:hypothetical protein
MPFHNNAMSEMLAHPVLKKTYEGINKRISATDIDPSGLGYIVHVVGGGNWEVASGDVYVMERMNGAGESMLQVIVPVALINRSCIVFNHYWPDPDHLYGATWVFDGISGKRRFCTMKHEPAANDEPVDNYVTGYLIGRNEADGIELIRDMLSAIGVSHVLL